LTCSHLHHHVSSSHHSLRPPREPEPEKRSGTEKEEIEPEKKNQAREKKNQSERKEIRAREEKNQSQRKKNQRETSRESSLYDVFSHRQFMTFHTPSLYDVSPSFTPRESRARDRTLSCFDEAREPCCWFGLWQTLRAAQSSGKTEEEGLVGILFPFFHVSCDVMCGVCLRPQLSKRCVAGWRWLPARSLLFWLRWRQTGVGGAIQRKDCEDEGLVGILFPFFHMIV
jgi:hypothetical protein